MRETESTDYCLKRLKTSLTMVFFIYDKSYVNDVNINKSWVFICKYLMCSTCKTSEIFVPSLKQFEISAILPSISNEA